MIITAAIIDDEEHIRDTLEKMIHLYYPSVEIIVKQGNLQSAVKLISLSKPNIVFLDIQLTGGTGFDLLRHFPSPFFKIIFITAYNEYAIQAFKFSVLDYLLKPIDPDDLCKALHKAEKMLEQESMPLRLQTFLNNLSSQAKEVRNLVLKTAESIYVVNINDIIRCEASDNYTHFFLAGNKKILVSNTLKEYDELLTGYDFFRAHQSHLLNLYYFERYDKKDGGVIVMKDGSVIPVSMRKKEHLLKRLQSF